MILRSLFLLMSFPYQRFSHTNIKQDNNAISFSPNIFPLGFKGVLVTYHTDWFLLKIFP
jgi:hypothetical protein